MESLQHILRVVLSLLLLVAVSAVAEAQSTRDPAVQEAYDAGLELLGQENYDEAIVEFDKASAADDTFAEAYLGRADALRAMEDYQGALQAYTAARDRSPDLSRVHFGMGMCHRELGQLDLALNAFTNASDLNRRDPEIAANLGKLYLDISDPVNALRTLDVAIELDPDNAENYRHRGWAHTQLRETEQGIEDLKKSIELDPEEYETYYRLANVYGFDEDYAMVIEPLTNAIKYYEPEESSDPEIFIGGYLLLADARIKLASDEETSVEQRNTLYEKVIEDVQVVLDEFPDRFPESGNALYFRGLALRMLSRYGEAIKALTDSIQLIPADNEANYLGEAYLKRGVCWLNQGENGLARRDFEQAASLNFEDPLPHLFIGFTYAKEEEYRKAIDSYSEAISKSGNFARAFVNRGLAYLQLEEYQKAVDNFNEAIRNEPTVAEHFFKRGVAYMWLDEYEKAFTSFELATLYDEHHAKAFRGAAIALKKLDRANLAAQYESKAAELEAAE